MEDILRANHRMHTVLLFLAWCCFNLEVGAAAGLVLDVAMQ